MIPRVTPPPTREQVRLLALDPGKKNIVHTAASNLPALFTPGDLLVVNDAATLPGSLRAHDEGTEFEIRLLHYQSDNRWWTVVYRGGSWRQDTELREVARLEVGSQLVVGGVESLEVRARHPSLPGVYELDFGENGVRTLYRYGRPIQYSHLREGLDLWDVQTSYAGRPWAIEMPSAGRPLSWRILSGLLERGIGVAPLTHAAGISSTGVAAIDRKLPLPERYEIPASTVAAIHSAKKKGRQVIAVGTSVVRALEDSQSRYGELRAGPGTATLILGPTSRCEVVDGLISGFHAPNETHYQVLRAVAGPWAASSAFEIGRESRYRSHEFGDLVLIARELGAIRSAEPKRPRGQLRAGAGAG